MPANAAVIAAGNRMAAMQRARAAASSVGGQVQGRGVQVGPVGAQRAQRQQVKVQRAQNNAEWEAAKAKFKQTSQAQQGPGGLGGFVGGILDNPIVSTALKPLQTLAYPMRGVVAGLQEVREHVPTPFLAASGLAAPLLLMDKDRAEADPRSWWEKVNDPEYGFGQTARQIDTGNEAINNWGNRAVGLWGDIALDPLTYASAGMNKIPGATGRVALATEAFERGLGEDVIRAAGRQGARGVRALGDEAAVRALQLPEPGLRFGGELGPRVPFTGKLSEGLDAALARVRAPLTDTGFGEATRKLGAARHPGTRAAVESLVSGSETLTPSVAAGHIFTEWGSQADERALTAALENTARDINRKGKGNAELTDALEMGKTGEPVVDAWRDMNRQVRDRQLAAGVSVGELGGDEGLDWVPHLATKKMNQAMKHPGTSGFGVQSLGAESQQFSRVIRPGETFTVMGKKFEPIIGTIKEANDWGLANVGFKLFEDDPGKLAAYAVEQGASAVGKVSKLQRLIEAGKAGSTVDPRFTSVSKKATRKASKAAGGELADVLEPILRDISAGTARVGETGRLADEAAQAAQQFEREAGRVQRRAYGEAYGEANAATAARAEAARAAPDVTAQLEPLRGQLGEAQRAEAIAQREADQLQQLTNAGLQGPRMTSELVAPQVQRLEDQFQRYAGLTKRFIEAGDEANARQAMLRAKATQEQLGDLMRRYEVPVQGAPLPEAAPFEEALQRATGARQSLEEQLAPLQAQQAAHEALGPPPNVDEMVSKRVQPVLDQLAEGREGLAHYRNASDMADVMAQASVGMSEREFEQAIAHLPEPARAMMEVTMKGDRSPKVMSKMLNDIRKGKLDDQVVRQANEGYELMNTDRLLGRDIVINSEMRQAMRDSDEAMRRFNEVMNRDRGLFGKVVDEYTKFFKSWATATPGFHVRNAMSATFMNMSEGVSFKEMLDGNLIWKTWRRYGGGSELARIPGRRIAPEVDWASHLPERLRAVAPDVVSAVYASGAGGRYGAAELGQRAFGEAGAEGSRIGAALRKTYENRLLEASHNVGEHVEGRVRSGLALHALGPDGSGSYAEAVQRIKRVHFDYSDVNELDRSLRRVIPFWTFMSRNLPLQVQQMWTAPRAYAQYQSVMRNIDQDPTGQLLMPDYLRRSGAKFISPDYALAPDIGPAQIDQYLGQIADPSSLLANLNPIIKSPLQLATNQNFFYGNQYKANDYQQPGWEAAIPSALLAMVGVGQRTKQGGVVQERKVLDAIRDLLPLTAQVNRLGSTTADREGKGLQAKLGYIGVPVRKVDQAKERKNRQYDQRGASYERQALRDALARFGGAA